MQEHDIEALEWAFLLQLADRFQIQLPHPAAKLDRIRSYKLHKDDILRQISADAVKGKDVSLKVVNGWGDLARRSP